MTWSKSTTENGRTKYYTKINNDWINVVILDNGNLFILFKGKKETLKGVKWNEERKTEILKLVIKHIVDKYDIQMKRGLMGAYDFICEIGKRQEIKAEKFGDGYDI